MGKVASGNREYTDSSSKDEEVSGFMPDFSDYYYRVDAVTVDPEVRAESDIAGPVQSSGQWFNGGRYPVLLFRSWQSHAHCQAYRR